MRPLDANTATLLVAPDEPALAGGRVAVARTATIAGPAELTVDGRRGALTVGVRAVGSDRVPDGLVVISESVAARAGFADGAAWRLSGASATPIGVLTLEATSEEPVDTLCAAVQRDPHLRGHCLWTSGDSGATVVELGSRQFRVRAVDGHSRPGVYEVVEDTVVDLFVPGSRVGLDVVVLADCSGSMEVDDLPVAEERVGWQPRNAYRTRLDALKEALHRMLQARLRVAGRESRFALIRFTRETQQRFPFGEGMLAVDAGSSLQDVNGFRRAIDTLDIGGGTDIAAALLHASEVLDRHGRPGNDRLIVLVSDGRPWAAKSADATGEVVFAVDDPVSLVAHLHRRRNVRLHAIGISNDTLYDAWLRRGYPDNPGLRPDHPLLARLVEVGGGDPTRIGGIDVLEGYFTGLGAGLTRTVGRTASPSASRHLAGTTAELIDQHLGRRSSDECASAATRLRRAMTELNDYARRLAGRDLGTYIPFDKTDRFDLVFDRDELLIPVRSEYEFETVLKALHIMLVEQGPGRGRADSTKPPAVLSEIYACFREYVGRLNALRQVHFHDKFDNSGRDMKDLTKAVEALLYYMNVRKIEPNDVARWAEFRRCLVIEAADVTERAVNVARTLATNPATVLHDAGEAVPEQTRPADVSIEFDLRIRN